MEKYRWEKSGMKNGKKKILSFLLVAVMVLTMMPIKAEAGEQTTAWEALQAAIRGDSTGYEDAAEQIKVEDEDTTGVRTVKLLADITAESGSTSLSVSKVKKIILDLNGHVII